MDQLAKGGAARCHRKFTVQSVEISVYGQLTSSCQLIMVGIRVSSSTK